MSLETVPMRTSRGWTWMLDSQWPAVFRPREHSWTDFTLIRLEIEHERAMANWNATIALLGFVAYVSYCYAEDAP